MSISRSSKSSHTCWRVSVLTSLLFILMMTPAHASWDESWLQAALDETPKSPSAPKAAQATAPPGTATAPPGAATTPQPSIPKGATESDLYRLGSDALDDERWNDAIAYMREVEHMRGARADRAVYWIAYAQSRRNQLSEALETVARLRREYPKSRWQRDAEALELEIRAAAGQRVAPEAESDEELKLIVLNSLMASDPDRAVPVIEKLLQSGTSSHKVKKQALFVLSQSGSLRAREVLGAYARGEADPELQKTAVEYLGLFGGSENSHLLEQIYLSSPSIDVRRKILETYMISGDADRLLNAAMKESQPELRRSAIEQIGLLGRADLLRELYSRESETDLRRRIIEAFMLAGEPAILYELARQEKEPSLRRTAIEHLGLMGQTDQLWLLYTNETDVDLRRRILESFMLTGDSQHLLEVARSDKDIELRRAAIEQLGLVGESESLGELYASESDPEIKARIIESLFLLGDDQALIRVARTEKNRDLRRAAIEKLALLNSDEATEFMMELLDE